MEHELKIKDNFFRAVDAEKKNFELRKDDRGFKNGDILILREWSDVMGNYTGRVIRRRITYIYHGTGIYGLAKGYSILGLEEV